MYPIIVTKQANEPLYHAMLKRKFQLLSGGIIFQFYYSIFLVMLDHLCPSPSPVSNGDIIKSGNTPSSCYTAKCHHGYRLTGNRYRTCQVNGEWSMATGVPPQCVPV